MAGGSTPNTISKNAEAVMQGGCVTMANRSSVCLCLRKQQETEGESTHGACHANPSYESQEDAKWTQKTDRSFFYPAKLAPKQSTDDSATNPCQKHQYKPHHDEDRPYNLLPDGRIVRLGRRRKVRIRLHFPDCSRREVRAKTETD